MERKNGNWKLASKAEPYKVPEGYFDDLYYAVINNKSSALPVHRQPLPFVRRWVLLPVAGLLITAIFLIAPQFTAVDQTYDLSQVSDTELMEAAAEIDGELVLEEAAEYAEVQESTDLLEFDEYTLTEEL